MTTPNTPAHAAAKAICPLSLEKPLAQAWIAEAAAIISAHFPAPSGSNWRVEYENDTDPGIVTDGVRHFGCDTEADAQWLLAAFSGSREAALARALEKWVTSCRKLRGVNEYNSEAVTHAENAVKVAEAEAGAALARYWEATGK